ncbi:MAG: Lrp/AsnC family transcriptional regulator [Gammaproteobacteria bacterium]
MARAFINRFQGGFPVTERPFSRVAAKLGTTESHLIQMTAGLLKSGALSRFGPLYHATAAGGQQTLAAMAIPESRYESVAEWVNALPEVAHNYRREHELNMWFVLASEQAERVALTLDRIREHTSLDVLDMPKLREFRLGLWLHLDEQGGVSSVPVPPAHRGIRSEVPYELDPLDRAIMAATQEGLPMHPRPYAQVAKAIGEAEPAVLQRLRLMLDNGVIRRMGAIPNHYRLGLRANGMSVWDVDEDQLEALGSAVGSLDFVSHCYQRPRHGKAWPYNLFAMVHGMDRDEVHAKTRRIKAQLGPACRGHQVLFSSRILKKTGLRIASGTPAATTAPEARKASTTHTSDSGDAPCFV